MSWFMVDALDRVGQRVLPSAECDPMDQRFRKVQADTFREALDAAAMQVSALKALAVVNGGGECVMSDRQLDWLIDSGLHPVDVVSIPNPMRCGILDAYVVGHKSSPSIAAARREKGLVDA